MSNHGTRAPEPGPEPEIDLTDVEPLVVEAGTVMVEKDPTPHDDDAVKIFLMITSTADVPVRVTIVDHHPAEGGPDEVAFHPGYDPENWTETTGGDVSYETVIQPGDQRVTVYGFRPSSHTELEWVLEPPTVETTPVDPPNPDERTAVFDGDDDDQQPGPDRGEPPNEIGGTECGTTAPGDGRVSDHFSAEDDDHPLDRLEESGSTGDSDPATDDDPFATVPEPPRREGESTDAFTRGSGTESPLDGGAGGGKEIERVHPSEPPTADGEIDGDDTGSGEGDDTGHRSPLGVDWYPDVTAPEQRDHVAEALVAEIEAGALDEDDLDVLRSLLDGDGLPRSVELKIDDLRRTVNELELYRDALEEFIDENGDAKDIIDEVWMELDAAEQERAHLADTVEEVPVLVDKVDALEAEFDAYDGEIETIQSAIRSLEDSHESDIDRIDDRFEELHRDLEETRRSLETDLAAIREDIQQGKQWREQLSEAIQLAPATGDDESDDRSSVE